jgi:TP901 family phage tail tape measure protein
LAATRKEYELLFQLKAALGSNFASTFKTAMQTTKQLQSTLADVKKVQSDISGFEKQRKAIETNKSKLADLQVEHEKLQREIKETGQPSEALTQKLKKNEQQISNTTAKIKSQQQELDKLGDKLKSAGVNTNNLTGANEKLEKAYKRVADSQEKLAKINAAQEKNAAAIASTRSQLLKTVGVAGALGAAFYAGPVKASMAFESAMADVVKVVDGLKDKSTGELTEEYRKMKKELIDLSTKVPMVATELTKIAASAGQAGIARQEIVRFAEDAAKMGVAFDTTADQAGEWMATWRTAFKMSQNEVVALADKINYLSDTTNAKAPQISSIVSKVGPLGEMAGLASGEVAALGATLVATGVQEDVAATGIKKLMTTMTAGNAATKRQISTLDKIGISAKDLAQRMQVDAKQAIIDFMAAIRRLPEAEQAAALKNYFGEEAIAPISKLTTNLELLEEQFNKVGDASKYAGSMEAEFASRSDTTENKIIIAKNSLNKLSMVLGDTFMPYVGQAAEKLSELVIKFADFAEKNPKLIATIGKIAAGLLAFKIGALGLKLAFLDIRGAGIAVSKVFALFGGKAAKASAEAITHTGTLSKMATGMKNYFGGVKGAAGGVSKAFSGAFGGTKAAGVFKGIAGGLSKVFGGFGGALTSVFTSFGGQATKIFATVGSAITKGPMGKVVSVLAGGFGKLAKVLGPVGKLIMTALGPLAGIAGSVLPVVGVIAAIVAGVQILFRNLDKVSGFIEEKFGPEAADVFNNIMNVVKNVGDTIKMIFSDESLGKARNFLVNIFGENSAGVIDGVITMIKTVRNIIGEFIAFCDNYVRPIIQSIFKFIVEEVLPLIAAKFAEWAPIISGIVQNLWTVISNIAAAILSVIQFVLPTITDIIKVAVQTISGIIGGVLKVIQGVLDFVVGVFTGDWKKAWEGVKSIFAGVWEALKSIVKAPLNFIITAINTLIRGLNKLKIPDWVPLVGGKGLSIPLIPMLAKGSKNTPSTFIAGEEGPELITNAPGRTVYTAKQTRAILDIIKWIKDLDFPMPTSGAGGLAFAGGYGTPATVLAGATYGTTITIQNSPIIQVDGAAPEDLDEKLQRNNENLLHMFDERLRKKDDDERRQRYE